MRIKPIPFNYGQLVKDMPKTEVKVQRKNVCVDNDLVGMWGEKLDEENGIMMLCSLSVKRDHTKNSKETLIDLWESTLSQYAVEEEPEEILARIQEKAQKEAEKAKAAAEAAKKAEEKSKAAQAKVDNNKKTESKKSEKAS